MANGISAALAQQRAENNFSFRDHDPRGGAEVPVVGFLLVLAAWWGSNWIGRRERAMPGGETPPPP
jgi:hypothetical protein